MSLASIRRLGSRSVGRFLQTTALGALLLATAMVAALSAPGISPTVHSGLFELGPVQGADIVCVSPDPPPDWGCIFDADGNVVNLYGGSAAAFLKDQTSQSGSLDSTTFSGAGTSNKNNDPVSCPTLSIKTCWHWDAGNVPAKDDFSNAYAWAKMNPANGHLIIYAGFERLDPSGDSHVDIEFFQDVVSLDEDPPCNDPGADMIPCSFLGTRLVGDIIVSMDFLVGGGFGSMSIREWTGSSYSLVGALGAEGCNTPDSICGFNNGFDIDGGPWPNYDRHGMEITTLPKNAFTEFGIDVTAVAGETPCISVVMGKTRSSQSFTAELKDFAGPVGFPLCSISWHKVDNKAQPLGGATFELCRTHSFVNGQFVDIPDECRTVVDNVDGDIDAGDVDLDGRPGEFEVGGLSLGRYTLRETVPPPGFGADPDTVTINFTGGSMHVDVGEAFVDERPILKLTEFGYTNTPTGTPTSGVVSGTTVYTVVLHNFGGATGVVSGSLTVTVSGQGGGTFACSGTGVSDCTLTFSGVSIAPGGEAVFSLTIQYTDFADGAQVGASLLASYTTPPDTTVVRVPSGVPATITFTVQGD